MGGTFKVPIRNLFCMISYVQETPELIKSLNETDEDLITYDFIANQFLKEVERLNRRGLVKNYVSKQETTNRLSGRMMMTESMPLIMSRQPAVVCEKDEYSIDILPNQILRSTLRELSLNRRLKEKTRRACFLAFDQLEGADTPALTKGTFAKVVYSRHNVHYKRALHIAQLLHEFTLLSHRQGGWSLFNAQLDERSLNALFEKFLFHFYRLEQQDFQVSSEVIQWQLEGNREFLPGMRTDISMIHKKRSEKIVMDAKFYRNLFQTHYGKSSFHSHNLYQLFTYLMHQPASDCLRGILVYPTNGIEVSEKYKWSDRITVEVMTVNLDDSWSEIHERLLGVVS